MGELISLGHGTADRATLLRLLTDAGVGQLVDVRRFPGSRRNEDVAREVLPTWLEAAGVSYRWEPRLGGRRRVPADADPDADRWWRVEAFRAYAAHMRTDEFREALAGLLEETGAAEQHTVVLCSETVWWRCHRRMVSDAAVLLHGTPVHHLLHDGRLTPHPPAAGARVAADGLHYDREEPA